MRKIVIFALLLALIPSCRKAHQEAAIKVFSDSVYALPPAEGFAACLDRLRRSPGENGLVYHTAYYRAVDAGRVKAYAHFLDSVKRLDGASPNIFYIATFRALCAYMLKDPALDSLVKVAAAVPPAADAVQEEICSHLTARLLSESNPQEAYRLQMRALHAMRNGANWHAPEILAQMALLCSDLGYYPESMNLLNEAQDSLQSRNCSALEAVYVFGNKANLYASVEMYDSALKVNSHAIALAYPNSNLLTDLLTFRAFIFAGKGRRDSAFLYLDSAERVINRQKAPYTEVLKRYIRGRRAVLTIDKDADQAILRGAIPDLEEYIADKPGLWEEKLSLGYARCLSGDNTGLALMLQARDSINAIHEPALLLRADRNIIDIYTRTGRYADASHLYGETFALADTLDIRHARYQSIAADLQYRVKMHMREKSQLRAQISQERSRVFWLTAACVLGGVLLAWAGIYLVLSIRLNRRRRAVDSRQITTLLENQKMLNRRLAKMQTEASLGQSIRDLSPSPMSAEDTARFRQSFKALYPDFLPRLHTRCPTLTPGDENLCMLISIGQTSDEIALALGISKASVNSARYRIRKKAALGKDESLDDLIKSL